MAQSKRRNNVKGKVIVSRMVGGTKQPPRRKSTFVVKGTVHYADNSPCAGVLVRVYDQDLRKAQLLGKARTRADGSYAISYTPRDFQDDEKGNADLRVCAVDAKGKELVAADILFNAPSKVNVDLTLPAEPERRSEFELLVNAILPLLKRQGKSGEDLAIIELEEKDRHILARETGCPQEHIEFLVAAVKASQATRASSLLTYKTHTSKLDRPVIPAEIFYGSFRQNLPTSLPELLKQRPDALRQSLESSFRNKIIPSALRDRLDGTLDCFQQMAAETLLRPAAVGEKPSLGDLLSTVLPDSQKQRKLAELYVSHQGPTESLWKTLRATPDFDRGEIDQIQTSLQLGALTGNHLPLVRELQRMGQEDPELNELRGFAKLELADWVNIISRPQENGQPIGFPADVQGEEESVKIANHAAHLHQYFENAFPTKVIAQRLEKEKQKDSPFGQIKNDLITFFAHNPTFEFRTNPVDLYLSQDRERRLEGVKQPEQLAIQLKNIQRMFKVTPRFEQISALLADNLHSSQAIVHMGRREFVERHRITFGGDEPAAIAYLRAEYIHLMALTLYAKHSVAFNAPLPYVITGDPAENKTQRIMNSSDKPDWRTLFGSLDLCDCEHCQSLYSPSAYLVDILKFLKDGPTKTDCTPFQVLLDRRPDIANTELTCKNTNTPMPYVDLVVEVLENAISPSSFSVVIPFSGSTIFLGDLNSKRVPADLKHDLANRGLSLSNSASVAVDERDKKWTIRDTGWRIMLSFASGLLSISTWPQTGGTAEELNANPEHTNTQAYEELREAIYPWTLPLNLWVEEARVYLNHLGVQRHEVMEISFKGLPSTAMANNTVAIEYLGLTLEEAKIINGTTTGGPSATTPDPGAWNFWGFSKQTLDSTNSIPDPLDRSKQITTGTWSDVLGKRVDVFLQQSGLSYRELLELFGTYYINPIQAGGQRTLGLVAIEKDDKGITVNPATCDLGKLQIQGLDVPTLSKIHRFVRLWRKLGWTMRDLDKTITALNPPHLGDDFLTQLSHVQRLLASLNVPLVNMLSWWANVDTAIYIDHLAEGQPEVASLYQQLFRNKTVINPLDEAFIEDPSGMTGNLSDHLPALASALGIGAADLALLTRGTSGVVTDDHLNLANLSRLYRGAFFAKALKLSIQEYLSIRKLTSLDPFAAIPATATEPAMPATGATLRFVEKVKTIRASGFSINELDYLLRHEFKPLSEVAPGEDTIALTLDEIRRGLQKIAAENTFSEDPGDPRGVTCDRSGELTRKSLSLLDWDATRTEQIVATLNDALTYEALTDTFLAGLVLPNDTGIYKIDLASLPNGFTFPQEVKGVVTYDTGNGKLRSSRRLSHHERETLRTVAAASSDQGLINATEDLFELQDELQGQITYDQVTIKGQTKGRLRFTGSMTNIRKALLDSVSMVQDFRDAVQELYNAPRKFLRRNMRTFSVQDLATDMPALPSTVQIPNILKSKVYFDVAPEPKQLHFIGPMTEQERDLLLDLSTIAPYRDAVRILFARSNVDSAVDLAGLPTSVKFPDTLSDKAYFDQTANPKQLHFIGAMTDQERIMLRDLSTSTTDPNHVGYLEAVQRLFQESHRSVTEPGDDFLVVQGQDNDITAMLNNPTLPEARFLRVLRKLIPYLRQTLSERLVTQKMAAALELEAKTAEALLKRVNSPNHSVKSISEFLVPVFAESNLNVSLTAAAFPDQFGTFTLLHKLAMPVSKFKIAPNELVWLFDHAPSVSWLDLNSLPMTATVSSAARFTGWERLVDLSRLRDTLPLGKLTLFDLFDIAVHVDSAASDSIKNAAKQQYLETLSKHSLWPIEDIEALLGPRHAHSQTGLYDYGFPEAYRDERMLTHLQRCFRLIKRLGASADQLAQWSKLNQTTAETLDNANSIKNAVKAKYDDQQWQAVAKPLKDLLREKQRAALVAYLIMHPDKSKGQNWRDVNTLYEHFLIDVEMSPCMMTTRLKQAINSVQLFIQRCLMNLEPAVSLDSQEAKEWREWRKQYRIWEANRKVFLYPENWIEPELRDDKSPFFKELENELLQNDVTMETAERAFRHYLEKLDEVARLEIVGMYYEQEAADTYTQTPAIDRLHVFGRTFAVPHIYYYRKLEKSIWSAWERMDLDIEGDHLVPVAWNRRLYLFWPILAEKASTPTADERKAGSDPQKHWEIKLAWSEFKNGKWSPKRVSLELLEPLKQDVLANKTIGQSLTFRTKNQKDELEIVCFGARETTSGISTPQAALTRIGDKDTEWSNPSTVTRIAGTVYDSNNLNKGIKNAKVKLSSDGWYYSAGGHDNWIQRVDLEFITNDNGQYYFDVSTGSGRPNRRFNVSVELDSQKYQGSPTSKTLYADSQHFYNRDFAFQSTSQAATPMAEPARPASRPVDMVPMGRFSFGSGQIARLETAVGAESPIPPQGTHIDSMRFVENAGEISLPNYQSRGDPILRTPSIFQLLPPDQDVQFTLQSPFFYQDDQRTYFVSPRPDDSWFATFFHPYIADLIKALDRDGIHGLLTLQNQRLDDRGNTFQNKYYPEPVYFSDQSVPKEDVDFEYEGAYSSYNWELFFHIPFLIATSLCKNQRFEEAQKWFHYVFDPTSGATGGPERFWKVKPFYEQAMKDIQTLEELMDDANALEKQVQQWSENPFKPHAVARLRVLAYMKAVVMKYLDNLIAWGDQLFRRDTIESTNEATQLYILAAQILGKRPEEIPARAIPKTQTFSSLTSGQMQLNALANAQVEIENFIFPSTVPSIPSSGGASSLGTMWLFCIPKNEVLLGYWKTVADRLFNIRHCMNIEGVTRQLPIFEPPIDPALLVRAAAAGVDISTALSDINAAVPHYRFNVMLQKAIELCNDVKALGAAMLSALEKRDAETVALLRSRHELNLLAEVRRVRVQQVNEAKESLESLRKAREVVNARFEHYRDVEFMIPWETTSMILAGGAMLAQIVGSVAEMFVAPASSMPEMTTGTSGAYGTPVATVSEGGPQAGRAAASVARVSRDLSTVLNMGASMSSIYGSYWRRWDDWKLQEKLANLELAQIDRQIAAAEIRQAIVDQELRNHDLQVANAKELDAFAREKYTNQELYNWMVGQLSGIYFQTFQLAYDIAKRAERAFRYELGLGDSNFIQFGYWDSLKKGLLAGEKLHYDLKRMDASYLDQNKREYEITKQIPLSQIDPLALVKLKSTGACEISLPELLFDMDYPGHYLRRIKSVSLTIPCVIGPYMGVNCTLTLLKSSIRRSNLPGSNYPQDGSGDDPRFAESYGTIQSIVTSGASYDSGMFETNLRDERFLAFEGAGAISTWRLELPQDYNYFSVDTISDVVMHLRYTAREGGDALRNAAANFVRGALPTQGVQVFDLRRQFASAWQKFLQPTTTSGTQELKIDLGNKDLFPFYARNRIIKVASFVLFAEMDIENDSAYVVTVIPKLPESPSTTATESTLPLSRTGLYGALHSAKYQAPQQRGDIGNWTIKIQKLGATDFKSLGPDEIKNLVIVISFETL